MQQPRAIQIGTSNPVEFLVLVQKGLRRTYFTATGPIPCVKLIAEEVQEKLGYPRPGYGGPDHLAHEPLHGMPNSFVTRWDCAGSAD